MGQPKVKLTAKATPARSQPSKPSKTGKSTPSKTSTKTKTGASKGIPSLFSGHEGVEIRRRVNRFFEQPQGGVSAGPATTYPSAYREAVQTKKGVPPSANKNSSAVEDLGEDEDTGEDEDASEDEDEGESGDNDDGDDNEGAEMEEQGSGEEDEGTEEVDDEAADDAAEEGEEPTLDEDEEREIRTVKGKGKGKNASGRALRFGGIVMLSAPFPKSGKQSKPDEKAIKTLEQMGLARFSTSGFAIPSHATYEEVDQILGELLPTPIDHLRSRLNEDDDVPVWELLKAEYRNLHQINATHPTADNIRSTWGEGRSIKAKVLFICPVFPFSKKALSKWRSDPEEESPTPAPEISVAKPVGASKKRKRQSPSKEEQDENCNDTDNENKRTTKKLRIMSPVDDAEPETSQAPLKRSSRSSTSRLQRGIKSEPSPLRERQPRVFLLSSPDRDFDPYANPSRYFGGL